MGRSKIAKHLYFIFFNMMCKFNAILIKNSTEIFDRLILKFQMYLKKSITFKKYLLMTGKLVFLDTKMYYKMAEIERVWH